MNSSPTDELQEAIPPIISLISKSEKAQRKLAPGTWQHTMLQDNLRALHIAFALMTRSMNDADVPRRDDLRAALRAFAAMTRSSERASEIRTGNFSIHVAAKQTQSVPHSRSTDQRRTEMTATANHALSFGSSPIVSVNWRREVGVGWVVEVDLV